MNHKSLLFVLAGAAVLAVSGCSGGAATVPNATVAAMLSPDASAERIGRFQAAGLNPAGAAFLASTALKITGSGQNTYRFTATFPGNAKADMTLTIRPDQKYTPTAEEAGAQDATYSASLTHSTTGSTYNLTLKYFLPDEAVPVARRTTNSVIQPAAYRRANPGYAAGAPGEGGGEETGMIVELQGAVSEAGSDFISKFEAVVLKEGLGKELAEKIGNPLSETAYSALEVFEVLENSMEYQELVSQLDELQMEAEYPTNALTQKEYAENPGLKQNILSEIESARLDLKWEAMAAYTSTEVSVALGLVEVPGLSVVLAPVVKWNVETAKRLMKDRVATIRRMVATGEVKTNLPSSTPPPSTTPDRTIPYPETTKAGDWSATYQGQHKTVYPDGTTITITDKGSMTFTVKADGSVVGSGSGHVVFHSQGSDGSYGDGETAYNFALTGEDIGGKILFAVDGVTTPAVFNVVGVAKDGHRVTSIQPVTAPLLARDPVDLRHGGTVKTTDDTNLGMQVTYVAVTTVN